MEIVSNYSADGIPKGIRAIYRNIRILQTELWLQERQQYENRPAES